MAISWLPGRLELSVIMWGIIACTFVSIGLIWYLGGWLLIWRCAVGVFGAFVWLGCALMVAFPEQAADLDYASLCSNFIHGKKLEVVFIPLLLVADILIDAMRSHELVNRIAAVKTKQGSVGLFLILIALVLYVVLFGVYAIKHPGRSFEFATIGFLCLGVVRAITYIPEAPKIVGDVPMTRI